MHVVCEIEKKKLWNLIIPLRMGKAIQVWMCHNASWSFETGNIPYLYACISSPPAIIKIHFFDYYS